MHNPCTYKCNENIKKKKLTKTKLKTLGNHNKAHQNKHENGIIEIETDRQQQCG